MEVIKVEKLVKEYGKKDNKTIALNGVDLTVEKGEFLSIIGKSGSGKSTLLHLIGGVDKPTSGKVIVNGHEIYKFNNDKLSKFRRRNVGIVYQFFNLLPILNVEENIVLPSDIDGRKHTKEFKERLEKLLDILELKEHRKKLPNQLSGGQQQRVSIGRALINSPAIILADEPTGNLDSKNAEEIIKLLEKANKELKQTIVMITHDTELSKRASRIITIEDGKIVSDERKIDNEN